MYMLMCSTTHVSHTSFDDIYSSLAGMRGLAEVLGADTLVTKSHDCAVINIAECTKLFTITLIYHIPLSSPLPV